MLYSNDSVIDMTESFGLKQYQTYGIVQKCRVEKSEARCIIALLLRMSTLFRFTAIFAT